MLPYGPGLSQSHPFHCGSLLPSSIWGPFASLPLLSYPFFSSGVQVPVPFPSIILSHAAFVVRLNKCGERE